MEREEPVLELDRLRQGDTGAYQDLVCAYGPRLLGAAERLGHTPQEAEDLVQDAFLALVRSADRFEGKATLFTWLYRVLLNRHADLLRRKRLDREKPAARPAPAAGPEAGREEQIRWALRQLREPEQRVLFLRFFEGLPYDEIARIVESPLGTVHSHAFHGLRRLRALLEDAP
jgi:RNA polymerase sigma-70 factor (ECF subfamily)